jgi:polyisoprenoid-binding protein YceI
VAGPRWRLINNDIGHFREHPRMRLPILCCTLSLTALFAAFPTQAQQKLVPAQSEIAFVTRQMGVPVDGKFRQFDAQMAFDPKQVAASKISFTIDLGSATIGTAETEAELLKPDWFDTRKFPKATFTSTGVKQVGVGKLEVAGTLSIKGLSRDVKFPMKHTAQGKDGLLTGSFTLKRADYTIGEGMWAKFDVVANDIQVNFSITASLGK